LKEGWTGGAAPIFARSAAPVNRMPLSRKIHFSPLQIGVHLAFWALAAWLAWDAWAGNLGVNPIQMATQRSGKYALVFLVLSLVCTPANSLFGLRQAITARRPLGVYAFLWAALHFTIFIWIDFAFQWEFIKVEIVEKRYIIAGATALFILTLLAATSFKWWQKRLGKNWKRLHKLVYLAAPVAVLHYAWARKGDIFRLQGDILQPLLFGLAVALLLIVRLPAVRTRLKRVFAWKRPAPASREAAHKNGTQMTPKARMDADNS
jgi:sulfoxide reductase heme-binding subunit YedZ